MKHQFRQPDPFQYDGNIRPVLYPQDKISSSAEQDTMKLSVAKVKDTFFQTVLNHLPRQLQYPFVTIRALVEDPQPEEFTTRGLAEGKRGTALGLFPILTFVTAFGLLLVSLSYYLSPYGNTIFEFVFLLGLLIMFLPHVVRLLSPAPSRLERLCLLCVLGIALYFVQLMVSALHFSSFDEFLHWRTADDILRTGHLFVDNSMLTTSPFYPGLEMLTNAISTTCGLSTFHAGVLVISAARLLMILSLFLLYEQITESSRMAGLATIIYMTNPHFVFFDAYYNYETLGLPLATFMLYLLARYETFGRKNYRWFIISAWVVLIAVTMTHHMTDFVFDGILILWAIISLFQKSSGIFRTHLGTIAMFGVLLSLAYAFLLPGNPVLSYLSEYFGHAFANLSQIIAGTGTPRALFATNPSIPPTPIWDRLLMAASVALALFGLPFGLLGIWQQHRHNALALTFGIFSLAYPISQVFRFTDFGAEITDRSGAFFFLPLAYILTIFITYFWPTRKQKLNRKAVLLISCAISVMFLGGVILEAGPALSNLPGPYEVTADERSVEPEGIQAAEWSLNYLGPDNRIATDRINQILLLTYGDQRIVTGLDDKLDVSPIFYSSTLGPNEMSILKQGKIRYLVVDLRLSTSLPLVGFYFEQNEVNSFQLTSPISRAALTKFNTIPQVNRLFDDGNIVIYDVGAIENGTGH